MKKIIGHVEYEILEVIAEGGMGTVFKALKKGANGFEKIVAIKMLLSCYSKNKRFINHFIDEAKLVANLVHENIVQIYQLDKDVNDYYFVLEYVDGTNLYDFMEFHRMSRTKLPVKLAVFIAANVARALAYAHSRHSNDGKALNIIHCDVCTHNILINTEGIVKLTDFGIARAATIKTQKSVSGKLPFMSPEQVNKKSLDFHSDIYSLGIVLFFMLSGGKNCRHLDTSLHEIMSQARTNYIDWDLLPTNLDTDLLVILRRMLATEPEKRYRSASKVARRLEYYNLQDGYSPNAASLAKYVQQEMPGLFGNKTVILDTSEIDVNKISQSGNDSELESKEKSDTLGKTRLMTKKELVKSGMLIEQVYLRKDDK